MRTLHAIILAAALPGAALASSHMDGGASAALKGPDGTEHGTVTIQPTASGQMLVTLDLTGIPEGEHGFHIHETGDCSADDFTSAGGHLAGDAEHGVMAENGPHPGDFPNITPNADGEVTLAYFNERLTGDMLMDDDGSAVVIHSGADDYESQPSGDAGSRIACGVIEASG